MNIGTDRKKEETHRPPGTFHPEMRSWSPKEQSLKVGCDVEGSAYLVQFEVAWAGGEGRVLEREGVFSTSK